MFTEIKDPAVGLETSLNAVGLVNRSPADRLKTSINYAHSRICLLLKLGVLRTG